MLVSFGVQEVLEFFGVAGFAEFVEDGAGGRITLGCFRAHAVETVLQSGDEFVLFRELSAQTRDLTFFFHNGLFVAANDFADRFVVQAFAGALVVVDIPHDGTGAIGTAGCAGRRRATGTSANSKEAGGDGTRD